MSDPKQRIARLESINLKLETLSESVKSPPENKPNVRTFKCNFGGGIMCEVQMPYDPPEHMADLSPEVQWTGRPSPKHYRPYIAWMNSVQAYLATQWNKKSLYTFLVSKNQGEVWMYEPNKAPKFMGVIEVKES